MEERRFETFRSTDFSRVLFVEKYPTEVGALTPVIEALLILSNSTCSPAQEIDQHKL
jgi:hypothetical protein